MCCKSRPFQKGHLDGIRSLVLVEPVDHILLEKVAIHTESQGVGVSQALFYLGKHILCKPDGGTAVIHIAGTVVRNKKMTTVGQVGGDRMVTGDFAMVRIISTAGAADAFSGAHDRAVHVDRQFSGAQQFGLLSNNVGVEGFQGVETLVGKPSQKRAHAAGRR